MQAAQTGLAALAALAPLAEPAPETNPVATIPVETRTDPDGVPIREIPVNFKKILAPYRELSWARSLWQVSSTFLLYAGTMTAMWFGYTYVSLWVTLALVPLAAACIVRLFILHHDCGHGCFFPNKRANDIVGFILGVLSFTPYQFWRWTHAMHHGSAGDLDHRGYGDIPTMTVEEYLAAGPMKRFFYKVYRHPLVIFGLLPTFIFVVYQRFAVGVPKTNKKARISVWISNVAIAAYVAGLILLLGFWATFWMLVPVIGVAASMGIWLFYVQHQYERTYWGRNDEWDFARAAMHGSSHYDLPKVLQWFTANIGLHHIHHLDSRIPNYNLQRCYDENEVFRKCERLTLLSSLKCAFMKLWDEDRQKMVGFSEARKVRKARRAEALRKAA